MEECLRVPLYFRVRMTDNEVIAYLKRLFRRFFIVRVVARSYGAPLSMESLEVDGVPLLIGNGE
ncbi:hypothetical protein TIFTF001_039938 [Ficus carica]|uniref:Uncharacterized protein n=1 Tax=Ficus carica TaxID=3494 RepID=A0AA87YWB9_FICCA|nr:hypothetical protein TIFTF001_039938 [Ficus carica]